jgi:hypothetical protein
LSVDDLLQDLDKSMLPYVSDMTSPNLDALTERDFTLLWEIYVHETTIDTQNVVVSYGLDIDFIVAKIQQGLRYRPFLCKICRYTQWWPSESIAIISEIEEFEDLDGSLYTHAEFLVSEWRLCYPPTFLNVDDPNSKSLLADFNGSESTAILAAEIYLRTHNISRVKYQELLEQFSLQYHWCLLITLYSNNYDLLIFVLEKHRDRIIDNARSDTSRDDLSSWSKLFMRNQAYGFMALIFTYFKDMNPMFAHTIYPGLLGGMLSTQIIDSRLVGLLLKEKLSRWIIDFVTQYGGYFSSQLILQLLIYLPELDLNTLFRNITDKFYCTRLNTPSTQMVFSSTCKSKMWRPEDLLQILIYLKTCGLHLQYIPQILSRDDSSSVNWILESLNPPPVQSTIKLVTDDRETRTKRKRCDTDDNDEKSNDETSATKRHNSAES